MNTTKPKKKDIQMARDGIAEMFSSAAENLGSIISGFDKDSFLGNIDEGLKQIPDEAIAEALINNSEPKKRFQVTLPLSRYFYYLRHANYQCRSMSEFVDYACKRHCSQNPLPDEKEEKGKIIPDC